MPWTECKNFKEEGWICQSRGFPLVAMIPWALCGLHLDGRAGASGLDTHLCIEKLFRDSGQIADQNDGSGNEKGGGGSPSGDGEEQRWDESTAQLYFLSFLM